MTGIAAVHALERLGWRHEATVLPPARTNEPDEAAPRLGGSNRLDRRPVVGLGSKREQGEL
jgi:hypothetical protein